MDELKIFELVNEYDRLIITKESELQKYFFENVDEKDITGNIELPLVYSDNSDYAKLKDLKKEYENELASITKKLANPKMYILPRVIDELRSMNVNENLQQVELDKMLNLFIKKEQKLKEKLECRLKSISEDPKMYIRFIELNNSNFSKIKDENIKNNLYQRRQEIFELKEKRREVLDSIKNNSSRKI